MTGASGCGIMFVSFILLVLYLALQHHAGEMDVGQKLHFRPAFCGRNSNWTSLLWAIKFKSETQKPKRQTEKKKSVKNAFDLTRLINAPFS